MSLKITQSLFLILMGSLDCLTTVIGTTYFGARELNPLIVGLLNTSLIFFLIVKLTITVVVALVFVLAQKILMQTKNKNSSSFKITFKTLRYGYFSVAIFLAVVVINNLLTLAHFLW